MHTITTTHNSLKFFSVFNGQNKLYKNWNALWYLLFSYAVAFLLLCCLLHVHLIALLTGNGKSNNQRNKLLKVHLAVAICVQVLHDLVDSSRVLLRLV